MYPFTITKPTTKKFPEKNDDRFIIIHHTAGGTFDSNVNHLSGNAVDANPVSTHFVIGQNEEVAKIGEPSDSQRHAGESSRGAIASFNYHSMGIEVVGFGEYNNHQFIRLTDLVEYLMGNFNIPKENVLRHSDITQIDKSLRDKMILWDGKQPSRKTDIALSFFPLGFKAWRDQLAPRMESRYK